MKAIGILLSLAICSIIIAIVFGSLFISNPFVVRDIFKFLTGVYIGGTATYISIEFYKWFKSNIK